MAPLPFTIRRTNENDWEQYRGIRLEMLADTPHAYMETLASAESHGEVEWRMRAARGEGTEQTLLVAIDDTSGRWVGTMAAFVHFAPQVRRRLLVGVYVAPSHRGPDTGVADALLNSIEEWAAALGSELFLQVHEHNPRAIAFYSRRGYTLTGQTEPFPLNTAELELEMVKSL